MENHFDKEKSDRERMECEKRMFRRQTYSQSGLRREANERGLSPRLLNKSGLTIKGRHITRTRSLGHSRRRIEGFFLARRVSDLNVRWEFLLGLGGLALFGRCLEEVFS